MIHLLIKYRISVTVLFFLIFFLRLTVNDFTFAGEGGYLLMWISSGILFFFWIIILIDMIREKIHQKTFWIVSMFFIPVLAPVVYLFQKKKLK